MAITLIPDEAMNSVVSHIDIVVADVAKHADEGAARGGERLASHHKTGAHEVTASHGEVDAFINLEGPAPLSVEFGHFVKGKYEREEPKFVEGLYIITGAAGMLE